MSRVLPTKVFQALLVGFFAGCHAKTDGPFATCVGGADSCHLDIGGDGLMELLQLKKNGLRSRRLSPEQGHMDRVSQTPSGNVVCVNHLESIINEAAALLPEYQQLFQVDLHDALVDYWTSGKNFDCAKQMCKVPCTITPVQNRTSTGINASNVATFGELGKFGVQMLVQRQINATTASQAACVKSVAQPVALLLSLLPDRNLDKTSLQSDLSPILEKVLEGDVTLVSDLAGEVLQLGLGCATADAVAEVIDEMLLGRLWPDGFAALFGVLPAKMPAWKFAATVTQVLIELHAASSVEKHLDTLADTMTTRAYPHMKRFQSFAQGVMQDCKDMIRPEVLQDPSVNGTKVQRARKKSPRTFVDPSTATNSTRACSLSAHSIFHRLTSFGLKLRGNFLKEQEEDLTVFFATGHWSKKLPPKDTWHRNRTSAEITNSTATPSTTATPNTTDTPNVTAPQLFQSGEGTESKLPSWVTNKGLIMLPDTDYPLTTQWVSLDQKAVISIADGFFSIISQHDASLQGDVIYNSSKDMFNPTPAVKLRAWNSYYQGKYYFAVAMYNSQGLMTWGTMETVANEPYGGLMVMNDCRLGLFPKDFRAYSGVVLGGAACSQSNQLFMSWDGQREVLKAGNKLQAKFSYISMQTDANLVLYFPSPSKSDLPIWATDTWQSWGGSGSYLVLQSDGNMVVYNSGTAKWASNTQGKGSAYAILQDDCNFVIYDFYRNPLWSSSVFCNPQSVIDPNGFKWSSTQRAAWYANDHLTSLVWQPDGNLVLYALPGKNGLTQYQVLWASNTFNSKNGGRYALTYQCDGNLVIYDGSNPLFAANRGGHSCNAESMMGFVSTAGDFILKSNNVTYWHTGTAAGSALSPTTMSCYTPIANVIIDIPLFFISLVTPFLPVPAGAPTSLFRQLMGMQVKSWHPDPATLLSTAQNLLNLISPSLLQLDAASALAASTIEGIANLIGGIITGLGLNLAVLTKNALAGMSTWDWVVGIASLVVSIASFIALGPVAWLAVNILNVGVSLINLVKDCLSLGQCLNGR